MNGDTQELQRMAANFSAALHQQQLQIEDGLRTMSAALDQAATRISYAMSGTPVATPPSPSSPAAATPISGGIVQVRVVNDRTAPVPVTIIAGGEAPQQERSGGGGIFGTIASGIGNFLGSLVGGVVGGIASPILGVVGIGELGVVVGEMIALAGRVQAILRDVRSLLHELVTSLRGLIRLLFDELTAAGIFPISRLIASLLFLIDRGITLVLMHIQPIIVWVERVIETVITWLGNFVNRAGAWIGGIVNALATFLAAYVTYLIDSIIRPAIDAMVRDAIRSAVSAFSGMLFGVLLALANVIRAAFDWAGNWLYYMLVQAFNATVAHLPGISAATATRPTAPDWAAEVHAGTGTGRLLGQALAEELLGPAPTRPPAGAGTAPGAPGTPPRFRMPGFAAPELRLPDMPGPGPRLEELLTHPPTAEPAPTRPETTAPAHPVVTGGITVQIRSETVSMENAEATARVIATHVADELDRLAQADRFRRGLPTTGIA